MLKLFYIYRNIYLKVYIRNKYITLKKKIVYLREKERTRGSDKISTEG